MASSVPLLAASQRVVVDEEDEGVVEHRVEVGQRLALRLEAVFAVVQVEVDRRADLVTCHREAVLLEEAPGAGREQRRTVLQELALHRAVVGELGPVVDRRRRGQRVLVVGRDERRAAMHADLEVVEAVEAPEVVQQVPDLRAGEAARLEGGAIELRCHPISELDGRVNVLAQHGHGGLDDGGWAHVGGSQGVLGRPRARRHTSGRPALVLRCERCPAPRSRATLPRQSG